MENRTLPEIDFAPVGPAVGDRFPDLQLPDQRGNIVDLHRARGNRRSLITFFRSADW